MPQSPASTASIPSSASSASSASSDSAASSAPSSQASTAHPAAASAALGQPVTPALREWVASQLADCRSTEELLESLLQAGWQRSTAQVALGLQVTRSVPAAGRPMPAVAVDAGGTMVDAGDRWVQVLRHVSAPELWEFAGLLSPAECDALIAAARPRLSRSLTVDTDTGGEELNGDRTSQGMFFLRGEDELIQRIEARVARLLQWPVKNGEGLQVLRYTPGAEYRPHHDYFDPGERGTATILRRGGQRVGTLLMYLQAPDSGGETVFPDVGLDIAPRRGHGVFFAYAEPTPDTLTLHGGAPVTAGEKWVATKWLREHEFN